MRKRILKLLFKSHLITGYFAAQLLSKKLHRKNSSVNYQPLPWIGVYESRRSEGTTQRWKAIEPHLETGHSLLDIGGNVGYFVFKAAEKKLFSLSIDNDLPSYLIANYVKNKADLQNANFILGTVDEHNIKSLPVFDIVLHFSVFHHWCANWGFEKASLVLQELLVDKTKKKMFFEMGQAEMSDRYNVPDMGNDHKKWITNFLAKLSPESEIVHLGESEVFVDAGRKKAMRHLFMINKNT